jgi:hypothetical protein
VAYVGRDNRNLIEIQYSCASFCSAPKFGGFVQTDLVPISISHCFFDRCFTEGALYCEGGCVHVENANANFSFCVFVGCYATASGGAISFSHGVVLRLEDTVFISCSSLSPGDAAGGGVRFYNTGGYFKNTSFIGCLSNKIGGGFAQAAEGVLGDRNVLCEDCIFAGNTGNAGGGGAFIHSSPVSLSRCCFYDNTAMFFGGGIAVQSMFSCTLYLCTFARNRVFGCSTGGGGGGFYNNPYATTYVFGMSDSVFYGNLLDASSCPQGMHILLLFFKLFVILFTQYFLLLFFF